MVTTRRTKLVFLEAFLLTVVVFGLGIFLGIFIESAFSKKAELSSFNSEVFLLDALALNQFIDLDNQTCESLIDSNVLFADRIYDEAKNLERLEQTGKLKNDLELIHGRYDLLRTLLWLNSVKIKEKCGADFSFVVYVYEYKTQDLTKLAKQQIWSDILAELKERKGDDLVLIPVAGDAGFTTLNTLLNGQGVSQDEFPVVIINNEYVLRDLKTPDQIEELLTKNS